MEPNGKKRMNTQNPISVTDNRMAACKRQTGKRAAFAISQKEDGKKRNIEKYAFLYSRNQFIPKLNQSQYKSLHNITTTTASASAQKKTEKKKKSDKKI